MVLSHEALIDTVGEPVVELHLDGPVPARLRLHGWSRGLLVERLDGDAWETLEADPGLFRLVPVQSVGAWNLAPVEATIPPTAKSLAAGFAHAQLDVLRLLQSSAGEELVRSAPTLAWLVASRLAEGASPHGPRADLALRPRRELLAFALGQPTTTAAMVRAAQRIELRRYDADELAALRALLVCEPALEAARRHQLWALRDLRHVVRVRRIAERAYLPELLTLARQTDSRAITEQESVVRDIHRMARALGRTGMGLRIRQVRSLAALAHLHDTLAAEYNALDPATRMRGGPMPTSLPAPPLPGDGHIEPLRTPEDYLAEGREMGHCVASYVMSAARGACAVYRLEAPERATIEVRMRGATLVLGQIRGPRNRPVSASTVAEVEAWFEAAVRARVTG